LDQQADNPSAHDHQIAGGQESQWIVAVAPACRESEVCRCNETPMAIGMKIVPDICRWQAPSVVAASSSALATIMTPVPTGTCRLPTGTCREGGGDRLGFDAGKQPLTPKRPGHGHVILGAPPKCDLRRRPPGPDAHAQLGAAVTRLCSEPRARCPCFCRTRLARSHPSDRRCRRNACVT
jgi:hypothetical protein